jgi:hypothetical protein
MRTGISSFALKSQLALSIVGPWLRISPLRLIPFRPNRFLRRENRIKLAFKELVSCCSLLVHPRSQADAHPRSQISGRKD